MVNLTTLAELVGAVLVIAGGFLVSVPLGLVALGAVLLYEAQP